MNNQSKTQTVLQQLLSDNYVAFSDIQRKLAELEESGELFVQEDSMDFIIQYEYDLILFDKSDVSTPISNCTYNKTINRFVDIIGERVLETEKCIELFIRYSNTPILPTINPHSQFTLDTSKLNTPINNIYTNHYKDMELPLDIYKPIPTVKEMQIITNTIGIRLKPKQNRNTLCDCNSGKKYKECCISNKYLKNER
jgi:hypothetical protein